MFQSSGRVLVTHTSKAYLLCDSFNKTDEKPNWHVSSVWGPPPSHSPHFGPTRGHPGPPLHNAILVLSRPSGPCTPKEVWSALNCSPVPLVQVVSQEQGWGLQVH